jgi:hypothetical protein
MMPCERCNKPSPRSTTGSYFNTQMICEDCDTEERAHPDFAAAMEACDDAVLSGERNFPGVGWPGIGGRVPVNKFGDAYPETKKRT